VTQAAFVGTDLGVHDLRVLQANAVERPVLGAEVHLGVGPAHLVELAVLLAGLLHLQRAVADVQRRGDDLQALRTQGSGPSGATTFHPCSLSSSSRVAGNRASGRRTSSSEAGPRADVAGGKVPVRLKLRNRAASVYIRTPWKVKAARTASPEARSIARNSA